MIIFFIFLCFLNEYNKSLYYILGKRNAIIEKVFYFIIQSKKIWINIILIDYFKNANNIFFWLKNNFFIVLKMRNIIIELQKELTYKVILLIKNINLMMYIYLFIIF